MSSERVNQGEAEHNHSDMPSSIVSPRRIFFGYSEVMEAAGYCRICKGPFTRDATSEETAEFERVQRIPLTEYRH